MPSVACVPLASILRNRYLMLIVNWSIAIWMYIFRYFLLCLCIYKCLTCICISISFHVVNKQYNTNLQNHISHPKREKIILSSHTFSFENVLQI